MKYVKILGLAVVAVMGLMAFLGAGSVSATVLCNTTTTPCSSVYSGAFIASLDKGSTATLESTSGSIEDTCTASTVEGSITEKGDATHTVVGAGEHLFFGSCTQTFKVLEETGTLELHNISGTDNGTLTAKKFRVTIVISGVSCVFGAGEGTDLGTLTGGNPATMDVHAVVPKVEGGFLCPSDSIWNAQYKVTSPNSTLHVEPS